MIQQAYKFDPATIAVAGLDVPPYIKSLSRFLNFDLYYGPAYYVPGESEPGDASCFDEGAKPFDFQRALKTVSDWAGDNLETKWVDSDSECVTDREPSGYEPCYLCDGEGTCTDLDFVGDAGDECPVCDGSGEVSDGSTWYEVSVRKQAADLFGSELARMF